MKRRSLAFRALALPLTLAVVLFHLVLLALRVSAGGFSDPLIVARWLAVPLLAIGVIWMRRRGLSLARGRGALVFWLVIALLHLGGLPAAELGVLSGPIELALIAAVLLAAVNLNGGRRRPIRPRLVVAPLPRSPQYALATVQGFSPRPPPRG